MALLALDFDGVISDSAPEAYWVALQTYLAILPSAELSAEAEHLLEGQPPEAAAPPASVITASPVYQAFVELMPLGNRAEDFGVVLATLARGETLPDQAAYDAAIARHDADFLQRFHEHFYRERDALAARAPQAWFGLLGPYPAFVEILKRRSQDTQLAIATAKDAPAVGRLVERYGLSDHIPAELICDKAHGRSKRAHLETLSQRSGVPLSEITFIDDKVNHLDDVAPLGVRCALAGWGYNGTREHEMARSQGFLVCGLEDAEASLFGPVG